MLSLSPASAGRPAVLRRCLSTHTVLNQVPEYGDFDAFGSDKVRAAAAASGYRRRPLLGGEVRGPLCRRSWTSWARSVANGDSRS
jgi:hypothetical protein